MLQMHFVGVSHFAKYGTNRPLTIREMLTTVQKPPFRNGEENDKVIKNPHADPDHHQKVGPRPYPRSSVILFTE